MKQLTVLALLLPGACAGGEPDRPRVLVAMSLRPIAEEIAKQWGRPVDFQFAATSTLARQIREGAEADVFLSANPQWVEKVESLERFDWLGNRLVLIVAKDAPDLELGSLDTLVVGAEGVPCGNYAREAVRALGLPKDVRLISGSNVRDVMTKVFEGAGPAGIVYATDVRVDPRVRAERELAEDSHSPIVYVAALLTERGRPFFEALRKPWAGELARRHGFVTR